MAGLPKILLAFSTFQLGDLSFESSHLAGVVVVDLVNFSAYDTTKDGGGDVALGVDGFGDRIC